MKSLHKKAGAVALSSALVVGGVLSSEVSSFAASNSKVSESSSQQVQPDKRVNFYVKKYGSIISVDKEENKLNKQSLYEKRKCYNNGRSVKVRSVSAIGRYIYDAKYRGYKFVKIQFNDLYYLIALN